MPLNENPPGGNILAGTFNNEGCQINGSTFNITGNATFGGTSENENAKNLRLACRKALFLRDPLDDRETLRRAKPRLIEESCVWLLDNAIFQSTIGAHTGSRILWISAGAGMGKTMMSLFILRQLETQLDGDSESVLIYYFVDKRDDKRNTGVSILRGLMHRLLQQHSDAVQYILEDYQLQEETLFGQNSLTPLWRIFTEMLRSIPTKTVFCLIDGLDECEVISLQLLLQRLASLIEDETERHKQNLAREAAINEVQKLKKQLPELQPPVLKIILLSRDEPACLPDNLAQLPRICIGNSTKPISKSRIEGVQDILTSQNPSRNDGRTLQGRLPLPSRISGDYGTGETYLSSNTPIDEITTHLESHALETGGTHALKPGAQEQSASAVLSTYLSVKLKEMLNGNSSSDKLHTHLVEELQLRGDGSFLWIDLALQQLKADNFKNIDQALNDLPPTLNHMYCRILRSIPEECKLMAISMLRWLIVARRPLHVSEIAATKGLLNHNVADVFPSILETIGLCRGLLSVDAGSNVSMAHASVIDFLTDPQGLLNNIPELACFHVIVPDAHDEIARLCISTFESSPLITAPMHPMRSLELHSQKFPLLAYAIEFWPEHFRLARQPKFSLSKLFFRETSLLRRNWWQTYARIFARSSHACIFEGHALLHLAVYFNLVALAERMYRGGLLEAQINKELYTRGTSTSTPLCVAAAYGNFEIFLFLLDHGADENITRGPGHSPVLHDVCFYGHLDMLNILLSRRSDVNVPVTKIPPPSSTKQKLSSTVTRWLGDIALSYFDQDDRIGLLRSLSPGTTALQSACRGGHVTTVATLILHGAKIEQATEDGATALHFAAYMGHTDCVKVLLEHGADVMKTHKSGQTPLHYAAGRGKLDTIRLLLDAHEHVNAVDAKGRIALHAAVQFNYEAAVRELIRASALINARSKNGRTPLFLASETGSRDAVKTLLEFGADKTIQDKNGTTALSIAKSDEVRQLLDDGNFGTTTTSDKLTLQSSSQPPAPTPGPNHQGDRTQTTQRKIGGWTFTTSSSSGWRLT